MTKYRTPQCNVTIVTR